MPKKIMWIVKKITLKTNEVAVNCDVKKSICICARLEKEKKNNEINNQRKSSKISECES